ncbi:serine hydrolase domain-containing protein [Gemmatimonadota bacterium]
MAQRPMIPLLPALMVVTFLSGYQCSTGSAPPEDTWTYQIPMQVAGDWSVGSLVEAGIDQAPIDTLITGIRAGDFGAVHGVLIVREGVLVLEEYFPGTDIDMMDKDFSRDTLHQTASCTKSVTSILIGIAFNHGLLTDLTETLPQLFPDYTDLDWSGGRQDITLEHLLTMRAGMFWNENPADPDNSHLGLYSGSDPIRYILELPMTDVPGTRWHYNSGLPILLGAILRNRTGLNAEQFAVQYLFTPLGIDACDWSLMPDGAPHTGGGLALRPRDMARIGQLYLQDGLWNSARIVSEEWVEESTRTHSDEARYGYLWWLDTHDIDGHEYHSFLAWGYGGQHIFVIRELELVVVFTGANIETGQPPWRMLEGFILPAIRR